MILNETHQMYAYTDNAGIKASHNTGIKIIPGWGNIISDVWISTLNFNSWDFIKLDYKM